MQYDKLKKRVFESAWQIVESEGMEQLNVRKLAQMSSCALGSIYNAYGSFQDLQLHLNAQILFKLFAFLLETIEDGIRRQLALKDLFRELGHSYIEFGKQNPFLWKALFEHFPYEPLPAWYKEKTQEGIDLICKRISEAFFLPDDEAKRIVSFFWASIHGVSAILINKKMKMVAGFFNIDSLNTYVEYCIDGLFQEALVSS